MPKLFLFLVLFLSISINTVHANEDINVKEWSKLPILHEGRIKPIDSFARLHLKKFSGKESINNQSASEWLAHVLFAPEDAAQMPLFKFRGLQNILNLSDKKKHSYTAILNALGKQEELVTSLLENDPKKWTPEQQSLMTLYQNVGLYSQLLRSITGLLPLSINTDKNESYFDLKIKKKENSELLNLIQQGGNNNNILRIISQSNNGLFLSPWEVLQQEGITEKNLSTLNHWQNLANAHREGNQTTWHDTVHQLTSKPSNKRLKTEYFYNHVHLLMIASALAFLSFMLIVTNTLIKKNTFIKLAAFSFTTALIANAGDIALRIYILNRPPVGTLYESIIFVALICGVGFLWMAFKQKNQTGILLGSLSSLLLLTVAHSFTGDDTMDTLVAVLNTNFWLLTHVICITIGYATCFIAALIAHYSLILNAFKPLTKQQLSDLVQNTKTVVILSLLFTTIGTILGGIWADQSWGRFWGWDPKENGALLIVIWLIWLLHGRISKHINDIGFMVGSASLSIIVVLAWFGVNLLSVGLHSYGFITGVAMGITIFCIAEILLIGGLWFMNNKQKIAS